jgi:hypothetical protein
MEAELIWTADHLAQLSDVEREEHEAQVFLASSHERRRELDETWWHLADCRLKRAKKGDATV